MFDLKTADIAAKIDALLVFLPALESGEAGTWQGGEKRKDGSFTMPWFDFNATTLAFKRGCSANGWVVSEFDWNAWAATAQWYVDDPRRLENSDLSTIQKLLTAHIRADRFIEGHLAAVIESGHVAAILIRLREIRRQL